MNHFHAFVDQTIIANIVDNFASAGDVLMFESIVIYVFIYLIIPLFLLTKFHYKTKFDRKISITITTILLIFLLIFLSMNHIKRKGLISAYPPISLIKSVISYNNEIGFFKKNTKPLESINAAFPSKIDPHKIANLKVVLVVGESARAKSFSINGYERNTNPLLTKQKNLISFKDVLPCDIYTSYSVSCMLSSKGKKKFNFDKITEESIIKIFEKNKFSTTWLSSQKARGENNALIKTGMQAQKYSFGDKIADRIGANLIYDEYLFSDFDEDLKNKGDNFIIMQTLGSHFLFHERYPQKFEIFKPACQKKNIEKCSTKEVYNAYDNTILYTDFIIDSIINKLKNENAILIYVSDHGSFLGENGTYYHAIHETMESEENKVAMFLWMSDSVLKNDFYKKKFLNAKNKTNKKLSHDNIFYSLLDCSGINVKDEKKLSICR